MKRLIWSALFGGLMFEAMRRVGRVREPEADPQPAQWSPLTFDNQTA